ncbi:MAG: hypothetical protein ABW157_01315 [Candidatus Thiodiazotropha sp. LLP2]
MRWILILIALSLSACSTGYQTISDLNNPYYRLPVGSTIVLKQALVIAPNRTRLFLQQGQSMLLEDFDRYEPNCNFEVRSLVDEQQIVNPETFTITKVEELMVEVVQAEQEYGYVTVGLDDSGTPMVSRGYHFWLDSRHHPEVMRLTCRSAFDDMWNALPPTISEIRQALDEVAELQLAL